MTLSSLTSDYYPHPLGSFYSKCIAVGYLCNLNFLIFKIGIIITISQGYYEVRWANTESYIYIYIYNTESYIYIYIYIYIYMYIYIYNRDSVSVNSVFLLSSYINIPFMMVFSLLLLRNKHFSSALLLIFSCVSAGKESACNVGDLDSVPGLGRFPWRRE